MLAKLSTIHAWAYLYIASITKPYIVPVLEPHMASLCKLWLGSLKDYARIRLDPGMVTVSHTGKAADTSGTLDSMYASSTKEVLLEASVQCNSWSYSFCPCCLHPIHQIVLPKGLDNHNESVCASY